MKNKTHNEKSRDEVKPETREGLYYIVNDAQRGRYEVPAGTGQVQVCVGHRIEIKWDENGRKSCYVPVYVTKTF